MRPRPASAPSKGRRRGGLGVLLTAVILLAPACGGDSAAKPPLFPPTPEVVVELDEYRFSYRAPVAAGRVVFRFTNVGGRPHRPSLLPLSDDLPPIDEQLRGTRRRPITPFAGIPTRAPGQKGSFAVELVAGTRYALICFMEDGDGRSHAVKGMSAEFRVPKGK